MNMKRIGLRAMGILLLISVGLLTVSKDIQRKKSTQRSAPWLRCKDGICSS